MTKIILTRYKATDGKLFEDAEKCREYEADGCVELFPLPDYGDHVPLTSTRLRWMIDGDGSCYYATATKYSRIRAASGNHPVWATHLVHFGK